MLQNRTDYLKSFDVLFEDYMEITRYIEPSVTNYKTFSHRIYALYLRACTEFESVCKDILTFENQLTKKRPNIDDYVKIEPYTDLEGRDVGFHFWNPTRLYIEPFRSWTTASPRLPWYDSYNKVKHNRAGNFENANFENLTFAIAGIFLVMVQTSVFPTIYNWQRVVQTDNGHFDYFYPQWGLSVRDRTSAPLLSENCSISIAP